VIPKDFITAWRAHAPWTIDAQVEQDLVISRALVEMFSVEELARNLLLRGGTGLSKLYFTPAARYSEDIDLVQARPAPIGDTIDRVRSVLDPWLGTPRRQLKEGSVTLVYRFNSEDAPPLKMRLKIEINTREHFSEMGRKTVPLVVDSDWFRDQAEIPTFALDELLGTKLRALYQRRKGRDLFDLWYALETGLATPSAVIPCFQRYMTEGGHAVSRAQFEENLAGKRALHAFREDIEPLLRPGIAWDFDAAMDAVLERVIAQLPGSPWKGRVE
jgi:predicted nucleotidyltransferase component of viral defense system